MSPVGGSRHYRGGGLGQIGMWSCPTCGEDNTGPLEQGCVHCGAGVPKQAAAPPTPPTPAPLHDDVQAEQGDVADYWARKNPQASIAEAYRAGYLAALEATRTAPRTHTVDAVGTGVMPQTIDAKTYRTVVAALSFFRDQILIGDPEEVAGGEWLSAVEATTVIEQLQQLLGTEVTRA